MTAEAWHRRYAWIVFAFIGGLGLILAVQFLFLPSMVASLFEGAGHPVPASIQSNADAASFIAFLDHWTGAALLSANGLTILIAATAFRRGERWAWYAMWFWPLTFISHFLLYGDGFLRWLQIFWIVVSVGLLLSNRTRFFAAQPA